MGRGRKGDGIEVRESSIRVNFTWQGRAFKESVYVDGRLLPPTAANQNYARRLVKEIRQQIEAGTFDLSAHFPRHNKPKPLLTAIAGGIYEEQIPEFVPVSRETFGAVADRYINAYVGKASTLRQYKSRLKHFWKPHLGEVACEDIKYSTILEVLKKGTWKSGKSFNNELSLVKNVLTFAVRDKVIVENPAELIDRAEYQRPPVDPFNQEEVLQILQSLKSRYPIQLHNLVQFKFYTGLRTSEVISLKWPNVDFARGEVLIESATVYDEESNSTKTYKSRKVKLNSESLAALKSQKEYTFLMDGPVFTDPKTGKAWAYEKLTNENFWTTTLKRLGIRYRRFYNTRHTYATLGLMSGANPGFLAKQLGHSKEMFFRVYADWLEGDSDALEMAKIEAKIQEGKQVFSPNFPLKAAS